MGAAGVVEVVVVASSCRRPPGGVLVEPGWSLSWPRGCALVWRALGGGRQGRERERESEGEQAAGSDGSEGPIPRGVSMASTHVTARPLGGPLSKLARLSLAVVSLELLFLPRLPSASPCVFRGGIHHYVIVLNCTVFALPPYGPIEATSLGCNS